MTQKDKKKKSSISLDEATRLALAKKKLIPRESYEDVIKRLILDEPEPEQIQV